MFKNPFWHFLTLRVLLFLSFMQRVGTTLIVVWIFAIFVISFMVQPRWIASPCCSLIFVLSVLTIQWNCSTAQTGAHGVTWMGELCVLYIHTAYIFLKSKTHENVWRHHFVCYFRSLYSNLSLCTEEISDCLLIPWPNSLVERKFVDLHAEYFKDCPTEELSDPPPAIVFALVITPICLIPIMVSLVVLKTKNGDGSSWGNICNTHIFSNMCHLFTPLHWLYLNDFTYFILPYASLTMKRNSDLTHYSRNLSGTWHEIYMKPAAAAIAEAF